MLDTTKTLPLLTQKSPSLQLGVVSTFPPTRCGIGRFASSFVDALAELDPSLSLQVVRLLRGRDGGTRSQNVVMEIDPNSRVSVRAAARHLSRLDMAIVQHEFGIFGENDGSSVVDLVTAIDTQKAVVLHTVLPRPSSTQKQIVESLAKEATVIVLCESAANLLRDRYSVPTGAIEVIRHGAQWSPQATNRPPHRQLITWGLLGPGKGLERSIAAVAGLRDVDPPIRYTIVGRTHPAVVARSGYEYRHRLQALVESLNAEDMIHFVDRYVSDGELFELVRDSDVVVVPYDNRDQVSSGVITEATGLGRPTIATRFPFAEEFLRSGAGLVVDHDQQSLSEAIRSLVADPVVYERAAEKARRVSLDLGWTTVASEYLRLIHSQVATSASA